VDKDTYQQGTESMQADYSTVMRSSVKSAAVIIAADTKRAEELGERTNCFARRRELGAICARAKAIGYTKSGKELVRRLTADVKTNARLAAPVARIRAGPSRVA
jgi:hypothetical protein